MKVLWTDKEVEAHWDKVANIYVQENNKVKYAHDQRFKETLFQLNLKKGLRILNITSRDCEADAYIHSAEDQVEVINAEISSGLIKIAGEIHPKAKQVKLDTYSQLPFEDRSFDRIISLETLEHVAEPGRFISELYRVAKPGARLVLSCPPATSEFPYRVYTFLFGGHGEGPHRFLASGEVKKLLSNGKWKLLLHKGTVLIPVGPRWLQNFGEKIIGKFQGTFISELGIRQFYVCDK